MQQPAKAVLGLASLTHERLAMIDEQPEVARRLVLERGRQVGMRERRAGDREGVDRVGFAKGTCALPRPAISFGGDSHHTLLGARKLERRPATARHHLNGPG